MKKQDIFNNNILWVGANKKIEEELNSIEETIKLFRDPNSVRFNKSIAANNISVHADKVRKLYKELESMEEEILNQYFYVYPDEKVEDDDQDSFS